MSRLKNSLSLLFRVKWRNGNIKANNLAAKYVYESLAPYFYRLKFRFPPKCGKSIWVDPKSIRLWWDRKPSDLVFEGQVCDGGWYKRRRYVADFLEDSPKGRGIRERYCEGKDWSETTLFKAYLSDLKNRPHRVYGETEESLLKKCHGVDRLFECIKSKGILEADGTNDVSPIYIHIGPEGELLYTSGGNHRLAIALVLGLDSMPVRVLRRHSRWQRIRDTALAARYEKVPDECKRYSGHPDLTD